MSIKDLPYFPLKYVSKQLSEREGSDDSPYFVRLQVTQKYVSLWVIQPFVTLDRGKNIYSTLQNVVEDGEENEGLCTYTVEDSYKKGRMLNVHARKGINDE